jgi:hypothetical protein
MHRYLLSFLSLYCLCGCSSNFEYRSLSQYKIDTTALKDGDTIRVIFSSGGPNSNEDREYLYHLIAVNVNKPEDTVNVLVPEISSLDESDNIKVFASQNSAIYKLFNSGKEISEIKHIDEAQPVEINKVVVHKDYLAPEDTHFPVIIGMLTESMSSLPGDTQQWIDKY